MLIVDASSLFRKGRAQNFLDPEHAAQIVAWVRAFEDVADRAKVVSLDEIKAEDWTLNISRYVLPPVGEDIPPLPEAVAAFKQAIAEARAAEDRLREVLTRGRLAVMSKAAGASEPAGARVVPVGRGQAAARADRRGRLQAVRLPAAVLQAPVGRVGRGVPSGARARPADAAYARATADDRFAIPEGAHWADVRAASRDVGRALVNAFRAIEAANPKRLAGIFGNASWTDKAQMPDETLKNLIEHFSQHDLGLTAVPEDELGNAYEYLIKQFADDSGHTAQEFYTNRTLVHLMTQMLEPQPGERIYDPTVGTGGMLISSLAEVKRRGGDARTLGLYGQELIHITAAIARMNLVLHGVEDFEIVAGNTLSNPGFIERDRLRTFDVVLANPPYSIKKWNREAWQNDPWGRNFLGTPPQGRADYAFFQHILKSLDPKTGRCAILFPHGVLFRNEEAEMRRKLVEADLIECVLGLGPNLFYNSPMEACVVVCRTRKPTARQRQDSVHRRRPRSGARAGAELPEAGAPAAHPRCVSRVRRRARLRQGRDDRRRAGEGREPLDSALRQAGWRRRREPTETGSEDGVGRIRRQRPGVLAADGRAVEMLDGVVAKRSPMSERLRNGWTRVAFGDVVRLSQRTRRRSRRRRFERTSVWSTSTRTTSRSALG